MKRNWRVLNADIHWFAYVSYFFNSINQESKLNHTIFSNEKKNNNRIIYMLVLQLKALNERKRWQ